MKYPTIRSHDCESGKGFDDPRVGLTQEPFVAGADTMIDRAVADFPNAERRVHA
jgi:hypothetical protein